MSSRRENGRQYLLSAHVGGRSPSAIPGFLAPVITVGALITFLLLSGVAVTALGALLTALLAVYILLVQVFGVSIELHPMGAR